MTLSNSVRKRDLKSAFPAFGGVAMKGMMSHLSYDKSRYDSTQLALIATMGNEFDIYLVPHNFSIRADNYQIIIDANIYYLNFNKVSRQWIAHRLGASSKNTVVEISWPCRMTKAFQYSQLTQIASLI